MRSAAFQANMPACDGLCSARTVRSSKERPQGASQRTLGDDDAGFFPLDFLALALEVTVLVALAFALALAAPVNFGAGVRACFGFG